MSHYAIDYNDSFLLYSTVFSSTILYYTIILHSTLPIVSIVVPVFGLTNFILRILKSNPQKGTTMETIGTILQEPCLRLLKGDSGFSLRFRF